MRPSVYQIPSSSRIFASFILLLVSLGTGAAETLRITTWNLQAVEPGIANQILTNGIEAAAAALKKLDPDVILLQEVLDWRMCSQLAEALKPAIYHVLVCSSFPEGPAKGRKNRQTAILSKRKAYFSWSEGWLGGQNDNKLPGGFVFAAIQTADHRVGLFSVALDERLLPNNSSKSGREQIEATCRTQWTRQIESIRKWVTNRPESAVVAGCLIGDAASQVLSRQAEAERVVNSLLAAPLSVDPPQTANRFSSRLTSNADALPALLLSRFPQTCDLDLELAEPSAVSSSAPEPLAIKELTAPEPISKPGEILPRESNLDLGDSDPQTLPFHKQLLWLALTPATILALAAGLYILARRENNPRREIHSNYLENGNSAHSRDSALITSRSTTGSTYDKSAMQQMQIWQQRALAAELKAQQANETIRAGIISYLREWLKQKLFRKLIADRAQLMESQQIATLKALDVNERLSRLEIQIQQQNQAYEQRIDRLTQELAITKEESRALIRTQITQIKAEMESARARLIAEAETREAVIR